MDRLMEIRSNDPRFGERRFVGRNAVRVDAVHAKRSITSTSTVRHGGLSTRTMGSCGRVGQNAVWLFVDRDQMDLTDIGDGRGGFGFGFDP